LLVAGDLSSLHAQLRVWLVGLSAAGAVGEAFVVTVVLLAVGRGLRPLRAAASEIASIDDRTLSRRVSEDAPHELEPVVRQINGMLDRIEGAFERERGFIANAAHELRTPLAGLRSRMEVSLRRPREPEAYRQALSEGLEAIESLQRLVESLMELARLESGRRRLRFEEVDVAAVVRAQWAEVEDTARGRGLRFDDRLGESTQVETDAVLVGRVAANLLANAAEYAPGGGVVEAGLDRSVAGVRLWVSNEADGLDEASSERLFVPFWRGDASRSATGRHAGLGLSIVRRCAEALGGSAGAEVMRNRVRIWVELPLPGRSP
jgi:two-component system heavy metal sensor histidine kinase CusS